MEIMESIQICQVEKYRKCNNINDLLKTHRSSKLMVVKDDKMYEFDPKYFDKRGKRTYGSVEYDKIGESIITGYGAILMRNFHDNCRENALLKRYVSQTLADQSSRSDIENQVTKIQPEKIYVLDVGIGRGKYPATNDDRF